MWVLKRTFVLGVYKLKKEKFCESALIGEAMLVLNNNWIKELDIHTKNPIISFVDINVKYYNNSKHGDTATKLTKNQN